MVTIPSLVICHTRLPRPPWQPGTAAVNCNFLLARILFDSFTLSRHLWLLRHARTRLGSHHKLTRRGMCKCHNLSVVSADTWIRNIPMRAVIFSDPSLSWRWNVDYMWCKSVSLPPCWWVAVRGVRSQMLGGQCCEGMSPGQLLLPINLRSLTAVFSAHNSAPAPGMRRRNVTSGHDDCCYCLN